VPHATTPRTALPPSPFVGRRVELERLLETLGHARQRRARTLFVCGESGVGKTRLARHAADLAREQEFMVAEGRAFAVESGLPYAIFADALQPLLRRLEPAARTVLTRGAGAELAGILPGLFPAPANPGAGGAAEQKVRMFWSFTELLTRLAARQPMLLLLDNLQWADPSSLELLHFVARQAHASPAGVPLAIVGTYADAPDDRHAALRATEQSLVELGAARVERLAPLTAEQTQELVRRLFDAPAAAVQDFAATLHDWTRGNAFFIDETLKSLVESGQLRRRDGGWTGWDVQALTPPRSVRDVVMDRAGRLGEAARALLDVGAVLGARMTVPALRAVSGLPGDELAGALDELEHAVLLVKPDGRSPQYDFAHPLVRDTLYAALGPVRTQGMHDRCATALEALYGADAGRHAAELAYHLTHGAGGAAGVRAAGYLAEAGREALARHADRAAVEYLEAALVQCSVAGDGDPACAPTDLLESLAHARQRVGDVAGAAAFWHMVRARAESAGDPRRVAITERRLGLMASASGDPSAAIAHFDAGLHALASQHEPALATRLLLARAHARQATGRHADALQDATAALSLATPLGDGALLARVHRALLLLHVWTGPSAEARVHGERAVALAAASGERSVEWSAHWAMAVHSGLTGEGTATAHHMREAERLADEVRSPVLRLWTADVGIEYLAGIGEWRRALALSDEAIPTARALGQRTLLPRLLVWTGLIHRGLGDLERARVLVEEAWTLAGAGPAAEGAHGARGTGDVHALVPAYTGMAGYLMTAGENARALQVGEAGLAIADRAGYVAWSIYRLLPFVIETSLYLEDYERAARHNTRLRRDSVALSHPLGLAWADTTDALLVYLGGDAARAVPMLRAATATLEQVPFVFDAAKLRRLVARALLDAGDDEGAAAELRKAHDVFVRLGAERELRLTREQMRGIGARPPAPRRGADASGTLSAREAEIARLVAARKSNKEIGAALDISSRTVSTHLSNIFVKLGVASRGELTDLVREGRLG
jgi:DNA-binding CsgD family transcriptional regulator